MIDPSEFERGWTLLQAAMPETELPDATRELYQHGTRGLAAGSFVAGVLGLISAPGFDNRRLPGLHELREACRAQARAPRGQPYVGEVPLRELLEALEPRDGQEPPREAVAALVERVARRAAPKLLRAGRPAFLPAPHPLMGAAEWAEKRGRLLEQADELLGSGEAVS